jgi:hypothetical protein
MAITHFKITKLPNTNKVISKVGVVALEENKLYPISQEAFLSFERVAVLDGYYVSEKLKFKAYDDVLAKYGNETSRDLVWMEQDPNILPASTSSESILLNSNSDNLLNLLPINDATEYVEIISYTGVPNLKSNGTVIAPGQRLSPYELYNAIYEVNANGGGDPYFSMTYRVGRDNVTEPTNYVLDIKVDSLGEIALSSQVSSNATESWTDSGGNTADYNTIRETAIANVTNGYQNGTAEIQISISSPFLAINEFNSVTIEINGDEYEKTADEVFTVTANLDVNGAVAIKVNNLIVETTAGPEDGSVTIDLLDINTNPALVHGTNNTITITSNF